MRTRIAGGLFPATLRVPGRVTTLNEKGGLLGRPIFSLDCSSP